LILYTKMIDKVLATMARYHMIKKGDTVAVALSGGADSMALFHLLCYHKEMLGIDLLAVHINHGLRAESDKEEELVKQYCRNMGVECVVLKAQLLEKEKPQGLSIESWARQVRYDFFSTVGESHKAKIATAHTLSDRCETVLFNISRGSSIKGAVGIPAVRDNIIRPLIDCTRTEIEEYCEENNIPYVTDKTNFEDVYSRNKIRLKVLPVLKQINPSVEKALGEFSLENEEVYTFLTQLGDNLYRNSTALGGFDISVIKKENKVVIKTFLRNVLESYGCLSKQNILSIYDGIFKGEFQGQLSKDITCTVKSGKLSFSTPQCCQENSSTEKIPVEIGKITSFLSQNYLISSYNAKEIKKNRENDKNYLNYCIDCDKIGDKLFFRTRQENDRFSFTKRNVTKTIKKLLIEDKV
ncbi:MAG: tRNA lysidine(34) synthetase TilS, partial [Oscillospiraceae bacterium]